MKRLFVDEERIEFAKDDQELMDILINDTTRICKGLMMGHKDGLEIFDEYFDLLGGVLLSEQFSTGIHFSYNIPVNDRAFKNEENNKIKKNYNWKDKVILIAEDEETNFLYLKAALSRTGANILRARTGKEAVNVIKTNNNVDIILMDIKMPEMNGVDATMEIRAHNKKVKIIAQTAYAMEEDRKLYFEAGCIDYLAKPIQRDLLLSTISKYL
ncbi:MAG: response regulator [Bacteroidales bacterium]|nr:response regulator [Bacteroidales bacterium]